MFMDSNPNELKPFIKAFKLREKDKDREMWQWCGSYLISAVTVAVDHVMNGKKAKSEYVKEPLRKQLLDGDGLTDEKKLEKEIEKAVAVEVAWIASLSSRNLPDTKL